MLSNRKVLLAVVGLILFAILAAAVGVVAFQWGHQISTANMLQENKIPEATASPVLTPRPTTPPPLVITNTPTPTFTPLPTLSVPATPPSTPTVTVTPTNTPTPTPTPIVVISQIHPLGRLETTEFVMRTVIDLENEPGNMWERVFGTDKLMLIAEGEVVGGFDLSKISEEDIEVNGTSVKLTLPPAEILYSRIDNERTYVYERQTGLFHRPDKTLESRARLLAEKSLTQWAEERDIYQKAEESGRIYLENFLRSLGFTKVDIEVRPKGL